MKLLMKLALRNLGRSRRRTTLMIAIVAFATWAIVVLWGLTEGFFQTMIDAQIRLDTGSVEIHRAGFLDDPDLKRALDDNALSRLISTLTQDPEIQAFSVRLKTEGLLKSAYGALGVEVRGLSETETKVTDLAKSLVEGRFLEKPGEIVLGRPLARDLDVRLGERVVVETQGLRKSTSRGFQLVGVLSTGLPLLDHSTAFIPLEDARTLTELAGGGTEVAIALPRGVNAQRIAEQLRKALGEEHTVSTLFELNPMMTDIIKAESTEMIPIMLILSLLAGFGVANTIMFTVLERTREFGVIMALGLKPRRLARLVLVESLLASGLGFAVGAAIGYGVVLYLAHVGIDFGFFTDAFPDLGMPHIIYGATSGWYWLYGLSVVVLTALAAAWYPARRVASLEPTEAMRRG